MTKDVLEAIIRTLLQMVGASLIGKGWVSENDWSLIAGGLVAAVGVIWMIVARWNTAKVPAEIAAQIDGVPR